MLSLVTVIKTIDQLKDFIQNHSKVVVKSTAPWCGPCKKIAPVFEALSKDFKELKFAKFNIEVAEDVAEFLDIKALPTFVFFFNGQVVKKLTGCNATRLKESVINLDFRLDAIKGSPEAKEKCADDSDTSQRSNAFLVEP